MFPEQNVVDNFYGDFTGLFVDKDGICDEAATEVEHEHDLRSGVSAGGKPYSYAAVGSWLADRYYIICNQREIKCNTFTFLKIPIIL